MTTTHTTHLRLRTLAILFWIGSTIFPSSSAFVPSPIKPCSSLVTLQSAATAQLDESQRAQLFQSMLANLQQVEKIPIFGCDATEVHTMNAALWTTLADLSENDQAQKVCMVLDKIPMEAILAFARDFGDVRTQKRLMDHLPELQRITISVLGKGIGPALIFQTTRRTPEELQEKNARKAIEEGLDEYRCTAALESFVDRIVVTEGACPYTKTPVWSATGLEKRGVTPGPVAYPFSKSSDACAAVASFWTMGVCELVQTPESEISTTLLSLPAIGPGNTRAHHDRFAAVVELISRNLCLFRGDAMFGLVHFHPAYQRNLIHPIDQPSFGHLPPQSWLRSMLRRNGNLAEAQSLTDDELELSNYQRRAPHTMINILRASQLNAAVGAKSIVDLEVYDDDKGGSGVVRIEKASGIPLYSRNAIRLARMNRERLQLAVDVEMNMSLYGVELKTF